MSDLHVRPRLWGIALLLLIAWVFDAGRTASAAGRVENVEVCSLYGAGYYYILGTDSCIKLGGWVQPEPQGTGRVCNGQYFTSGKTCTRSGPNVVDVTACTYGTLRGYVSLGSSCPVAETSRAFVEFAGFTSGRSESFFDFFSSTAFNSYDFNFRVKGGSNEKINTGGESITIGGLYQSPLGFNVSAAFSGTPIFNDSGNWQERFDHITLGSGSVTGSSVFDGTIALGYPITVFNNWKLEPFTAYRYTGVSLSGISDGMNESLLQSNTSEWQIGGSLGTVWNTPGMLFPQIASAVSGYFSPWAHNEVGGLYAGNGTSWGVEGDLIAQAPHNWYVKAFVGYWDDCGPVYYMMTKADYMASDWYGGVGVTRNLR